MLLLFLFIKVEFVNAICSMITCPKWAIYAIPTQKNEQKVLYMKYESFYLFILSFGDFVCVSFFPLRCDEL